jgi:hypothetical protein
VCRRFDLFSQRLGGLIVEHIQSVVVPDLEDFGSLDHA